MTKVYTLLVQNYDSLDGYMTSIDVKVFKNKDACEEWMVKEDEQQKDKGFDFNAIEADEDYWPFFKETDRGTYRHEFYGQYRDVIKGVE